jgi:hypothetical protein
MKSARALATFVAMAGMVACGLNATGQMIETEGDGPGSPSGSSSSGAADADATSNTADDGGNGGSEAGADSGADANADAAVACVADACTLPATGSGVELVLFGDRATGCPAGYDQSDVVEDPTPQAGACACGTCTKSASCNSGSIPSYYDNGGGTCGSSGATLDVNNGNCLNFSGTFGTNAEIGATTATGATCSVGASISNKANVAVTAGRICKIQASTCVATACVPPATMKACTVRAGDVACGGGETKRLVADDFTMTCATCTCSATATCSGTMSFYPSSGCTGTPKVLTTGVCTNTNGASIGSTKWVGTATTTCNLSSAPAPGITLSNTKTVCCP